MRGNERVNLLQSLTKTLEQIYFSAQTVHQKQLFTA